MSQATGMFHPSTPRRLTHLLAGTSLLVASSQNPARPIVLDGNRKFINWHWRLTQYQLDRCKKDRDIDSVLTKGLGLTSLLDRNQLTWIVTFCRYVHIKKVNIWHILIAHLIGLEQTFPKTVFIFFVGPIIKILQLNYILKFDNFFLLDIISSSKPN